MMEWTIAKLTASLFFLKMIHDLVALSSTAKRFNYSTELGRSVEAVSIQIR